MLDKLILHFEMQGNVKSGNISKFRPQEICMDDGCPIYLRFLNSDYQAFENEDGVTMIVVELSGLDTASYPGSTDMSSYRLSRMERVDVLQVEAGIHTDEYPEAKLVDGYCVFASSGAWKIPVEAIENSSVTINSIAMAI